MTDWYIPKNNANSTLANAIDEDDLSLTVATGESGRFPTSYPFLLTIEDEIIKVTSRTGDVLTIVRAQEGTAAASHTAGKAVRLNLTAATISQLQDAVDDKADAADVAPLIAPPSALVYKSSSQSIPHTTSTALTFNLESWDTDAIHDNATNNSRLICKTAGKYIVVGAAVFDGNATGTRCCLLYKNGAMEQQFTRVTPANTNESRLSAAWLVDLSVNDYIELYCYQNSGSALNAQGASYKTRFGMIRIGD